MVCGCDAVRLRLHPRCRHWHAEPGLPQLVPTVKRALGSLRLFRGRRPTGRTGHVKRTDVSELHLLRLRRGLRETAGPRGAGQRGVL